MNNTNLHKINEIMNIIKHSKDEEKRVLMQPSKNENLTCQKIRKYPRRLYLKKKAETASLKEKEEINIENKIENNILFSNNEIQNLKETKISRSIQNLKSITVI